MDFPIRLLTWRTYRDLSLKEVAARCGVTPQAISLGERGERDLRIGTLQPIVEKGLGISLARFFGNLPKITRPLTSKVGRPRKLSGVRAA